MHQTEVMTGNRRVTGRIEVFDLATPVAIA